MWYMFSPEENVKHNAAHSHGSASIVWLASAVLSCLPEVAAKPVVALGKEGRRRRGIR